MGPARNLAASRGTKPRVSTPRRRRRSSRDHDLPGMRLPRSQQLGVGLEPAAARRVAELAQRLGLDLADALAGHIEERAHLLERALGPVLGQSEAQPDD